MLYILLISQHLNTLEASAYIRIFETRMKIPIEAIYASHLVNFVVMILLVVFLTAWIKPNLIEKCRLVIMFGWACFIKPILYKLRVKPLEQQQSLENFYGSQAGIYDKTREVLLKGRRECLRLAMSHLNRKSGIVWVDIGGGTGWNITYMDSVSSIAENFEAVYLVDLSPSLCEVAKQRFAAKNWTNVHVVVGDATSFKIDNQFVDLVTFSYSLSMIPTFNSVIDNANNILATNGIVGCVDFGIQTVETSIGRVNTLGGLVKRNVPWILRNFWRIWFEADNVFLESSRRTYLEYKFGTIKSLNTYNMKLGKIPYYIWIGTHKMKPFDDLHMINSLATEVNSSTDKIGSVPISKGHEAALENVKRNLPFPSMYYQREIWRLYYDEIDPRHEQFRNQYIYSFTWEDPREDNRILQFSSEDTVLAITSAGDNILSYATLLNAPKAIHAVDLNPCQNHLLELKLASFRSLDLKSIWSMFGRGKVDHFSELLLDKLSPHMSSNAFQYWIHHGKKAFDENGNGLYDTGSTRWALRLARIIFTFFGLGDAIKELCNCRTMEEQTKLWRDKIRPCLFNKLVITFMIENPTFLWKALGVPTNQAAMIGGSMLKYIEDTLDPVIERSLISSDNYFYYLTLMGQYSLDNCPDYLTSKGYERLTRSNSSEKCPIDNIRLHTDSLIDVFSRLQLNSVTIAIIMDHMDWFDVNGQEAKKEIDALKKCLAPGGRVLLRSAAKCPWYLKTFEGSGFFCRAAAIRESGQSIDRTNMYASTWVCTKG
ncbi:uncharacterized protein PRCAT00001594001 [Priceomyces carsonii]|uniref:uncharacterized protein n=1 Tax=Priceomyces carsonii TaxID=28549 RepID=UPI002EDA3297|nr:unnamed protein product [Priceomyces carsonii]